MLLQRYGTEQDKAYTWRKYKREESWIDMRCWRGKRVNLRELQRKSYSTDPKLQTRWCVQSPTQSREATRRDRNPALPPSLLWNLTCFNSITFKYSVIVLYLVWHTLGWWGCGVTECDLLQDDSVFPNPNNCSWNEYRIISTNTRSSLFSMHHGLLTVNLLK